MGFYILLRADDKGASMYQEKEIHKKRGKKWESIYQEAQRTSSWTRGLTS
jgi:hypothetical protein